MNKRIIRGISLLLICSMLLTFFPIGAIAHNGQEHIEATSTFATTPMLTGGRSHTVALRNDGTVWAWGDNWNGQLGDNTTINRNTPAQIQSLNNIVAVATGGHHSVALESDGTVWTWGSNIFGGLGDGTGGSGSWNDHSTIPVRVQNLDNIIAIDAGEHYTVALRNDGTVWAWGDNSGGQLGDETTTDRTTPVRVQNLYNIEAIAAGHRRTLALDSGGKVWLWGSGISRNFSITPPQPEYTVPVLVEGLDSVSAIATGFRRTVSLTGAHNVALRNDGTVWTWGHNEAGVLGDRGNYPIDIPARVRNIEDIIGITAGTFTVALARNGTVNTWGDPILSAMNGANLRELSGIVSVASGEGHTMALSYDGSIWGWGDNSHGQLGDGTNVGNSPHWWWTGLPRVRTYPVQVVGENGVGHLNLGESTPPTTRRPIRDGIDNFSFTNNTPYFMSGPTFQEEDGTIVIILNGQPMATNRLTESYLDALMNHPDMTERHRRNIRDNWLGRGWEGACAGMALVLPLMMKEELTPSFFARRDNQLGANSLYELRIPRLSRETMNLIHYYQVLQLTPALIGISNDIRNMSPERQLRNIVSTMQESAYPVYIAFNLFNHNTGRPGGHAVLGHNIVETQNDYRIAIWDPNRPAITTTILIIDKNEEGGLSNARFVPDYLSLSNWTVTDNDIWKGLSVEHLADWNIQNILSGAEGRGRVGETPTPNQLENRTALTTTNLSSFTITSSNGLSATIVDYLSVSGTLDIGRGRPLNTAIGEPRIEFSIPRLAHGETYTITPHSNNNLYRITLSYDCPVNGFGTRVESRSNGDFIFDGRGSIRAEMLSRSTVSLDTVLNSTGYVLYATEVFGAATSMRIDIDGERRKVVSADTDNVRITASGTFTDITFPNVDMSSAVTVMQDANRIRLVNEEGNTLGDRLIPSGSTRHTIQIYWEPGGTVMGGGTYTASSDVTVTASPDSGYVFSGWYESGVRVSEEVRYMFTATRDRMLIARFTPTSQQPPNGGSGSGFVPPQDDDEEDEILQVLPFVDVHSSNWFYPYVRYVFENNIMQGTTRTSFAPNANFSRAQVVATLYRMVHGDMADEIPYDRNRAVFSDVGVNVWYSPYVIWAYDNGIVTGVGNNRFAPNEPVTREQFATMMYRFAEFREYDIEIRQGSQWNNFTDRDQISTWAGDGLIWANYHGLISGRTATAVIPDGTTTRAEASAILTRFMQTFNS